MGKTNHCIDCNALCWSLRCKRCSNRLNGLKNKNEWKIGMKCPAQSKFMSGENSPSYKHGKCKNNKCVDCDTHISYHGVRCRSCAGKYRMNIKFPTFNRGVNHPQYINGQGDADYPSIFNKELKEKIKKRDSYICQGENCSISSEEHLIIYDREIEIHHIDYDRKNCNEDNLITLCKQCNLRANFNRNYWKNYYIQKKTFCKTGV